MRRLFFILFVTAMTISLGAFMKFEVHASREYYLYWLIPLEIYFLIIALRPEWFAAFSRMIDEMVARGWKTLDKKKYNWPGFP
jgi:hypothetical protein